MRSKGEIFECPICHKKRKRKTLKQTFCSVKCYRIHYKTASKESAFPFYLCPNCGNKESLNFMPNRKKKVWDSYKCIKCGYLANTSEDSKNEGLGRAI